jgi:hypothetical protein
VTLLREDREKGFPGDDGIPIIGAVAPDTRLQVAKKHDALACARVSYSIPPSDCSVYWTFYFLLRLYLSNHREYVSTSFSLQGSIRFLLNLSLYRIRLAPTLSIRPLREQDKGLLRSE